ncbi:MAG: 4-hydroxythreonine-4-phosphate dehydrogenase PdxA [Deltaproteobacteria bacterium]|nr:4-hydroxythreonine-4-phosphate dehydrogenase PdxA [Deltaproteobacteria bacterium]
MRPMLAVSIGCPAGIGPEISLRAAIEHRRDADVVLVGDLALLRTRGDIVGSPASLVAVSDANEARSLPPRAIGVLSAAPPLSQDASRPGVATPEGGAAQLAWIDAACDLVARGDADALVTGPASKAAVASSGAPGAATFLGHTEHLGARLGGVETVMCFWAQTLTISLATTHLPLRAVAQSLRAEDVARATYWTARLMDELDVDPTLAIAVLSLNPHAGESGLLGDEERTVLDPGIALARERLAAEGRTRAIAGPVPAESAIRRTVHEHAYAACVAMYHDQATIPSKLVAFGDAVNVTLGMPIIRTSVDHGTAYDLAGTGRADARGMKAAMELATRLARKRGYQSTFSGAR